MGILPWDLRAVFNSSSLPIQSPYNPRLGIRCEYPDTSIEPTEATFGVSPRYGIHTGADPHTWRPSAPAHIFHHPPVPYRWRCEMFFGKATKFGVGTAALALVAMAGIGFAPAPTQLQTITVYHNPT